MMRFDVSYDLGMLAQYIPRFFGLVDRIRWYKRVAQLNEDQQTSPYLWKIVSDYHWLEMAISHQTDILAEEGRLLHEHVDSHALVALQFAGAIVEIHARLPEEAQRQLEGRLRDGLNAESGFAALYFEVDMALRLMAAGYTVRFPDLDGTGDYDIEFNRNGFVGEVECKSLSADAGRRIHRKDFFRFIQSLSPQLRVHADLERQEVLVITLEERLSSSVSEQAELRCATAVMLEANARSSMRGAGFRIERRVYNECLGAAPVDDERAFYRFCEDVFGRNCHIAGGLTENGGCLVVMRCEREDDTSKPWLDAMRKAASQLSGKRPSFIALQFQDITASDLMLPHLRRRAGILSYALFGHYGADHVNATYVCGFAAVVDREGQLGTPAFAIPNLNPRFPIDPGQATPFLVHIADADFAATIGAPLPEPNISQISLFGPCMPDPYPAQGGKEP